MCDTNFFHINAPFNKVPCKLETYVEHTIYPMYKSLRETFGEDVKIRICLYDDPKDLDNNTVDMSYFDNIDEFILENYPDLLGKYSFVIKERNTNG